MKNYLTQVTDNEIEVFLLQNGYILRKDIISNDGEPLPAIQRDEEGIFIRAQRTPPEAEGTSLQQINKPLENVIKMYALIRAISGDYSDNIDLISIENFHLSKICVSQIPEEREESERLYGAYVNWMAKKFPTYADDYNKYWDTQSESTMSDDNTL